MATVRITQRIRSEILEQRIPKLFKARKAKAIENFPEANLPATLKSAMNSFHQHTAGIPVDMMDGYFKKVTSIQVQCDYTYQGNAPDTERQATGIKEIRLSTPIFAPHLTHSLGGNFERAHGLRMGEIMFKVPKNTPYHAECAKYFNTIRKIRAEESTLRDNVEKVLDQCVTVRQYLHAWPQGESLIPQEALNRHYSVAAETRTKPEIKVQENLAADLLKAKIQT